MRVSRKAGAFREEGDLYTNSWEVKSCCTGVKGEKMLSPEAMGGAGVTGRGAPGPVGGRRFPKDSDVPLLSSLSESSRRVRILSSWFVAVFPAFGRETGTQ